MSIKKILVMDEEYWSIEPAIDRIESLFGNDIIEYCSNGIEGLMKLQNAKFSCVILDIMFPMGIQENEDVDDVQISINGGLTVLEEIRKNLRLELPVICFTVRDDDEVKNSIKKYNNTVHISKINASALDLLIGQIKRHIN